ncbi:CDP-alcohol phosphatidyltransferase family protein [Microbacterium sp.]|uniref:CDP-alcohol phosphatidyltransferase family protein n=1 Tax=Microbacterium sp. TaxID=51671 RepID=UPI0027356518|nr:CDP-alcohol phosphatidyltransferase family protein [Microbacterium sp.]MDP3953006.1 CDP-alcohol phosphatidyltransferase family protein [Microbacterium sp.]
MMHLPVARRGPHDWATVPNAITVLRLLLVIPITLLLVNDAAPVITLALLILFGLSDWVDGYLARRLRQTSRTGAILDPLADRLGVVTIAIAFVSSGHLPLWIIVLIATVDVALGAAYLCVRPARMPDVSSLGKIRTAALMAGLALIGVSILPTPDIVALIGQFVCGAGAVLHVFACFGYIRALGRR